jgi:hypothetical protein
MQKLTHEETIKAHNLLETQLQQEKINSLNLENQKETLEQKLNEKQQELETSQTLSEQQKQNLQTEINQQTDTLRKK